MTGTAMKRDQVAAMIRARIADGSLKPGALAPSGEKLALETGFAVLTCRAALRLLVDEGVLTRVSRTARPRVADAGAPGDAQQLTLALTQSLGRLRRAAGVSQEELATALGMSVTAVGHAETGRLWQARRFWENADRALQAGGGLMAGYDAWRAARTSSEMEAAAVPPAAPVAPVAPEVTVTPDGVLITLPCDPMTVTVKWGDGSVTTVQPDPARAGRGVG